MRACVDVTPFFLDAQTKAQSRIDVYKKLLRETEKEHVARKNDLESRIDSLQDKLQVHLSWGLYGSKMIATLYVTPLWY